MKGRKTKEGENLERDTQLVRMLPVATRWSKCIAHTLNVHLCSVCELLSYEKIRPLIRLVRVRKWKNPDAAASTRAEEGDKMAATMTKTLFLQKVQTFSQSSEFSVWCKPSWWWQTCCANRRMSTASLYSKANAAISYGKRGSAFPHVAESVFLGASDKIVFRQSAE